MTLDRTFWENRWKQGLTGWDTGGITTPIKEYIDQIENKGLRILIPGAGNGYEAEYLFHAGFENIFVVDIAKTPLENIKKRVSEFPIQNLMNENFFDLDDSFDLVLEQTFFCALDPSLRFRYAEKIHSILKENGKLVGVLFNIFLNEDNPPFGGTREEYLKYFQPLFQLKVFEPCYNSIKPRKDAELFIILQKN